MRLFVAGIVILLLALGSLLIGVGDVSWHALVTPSPDEQALQLLVISRIPRLLAVMLVGTSLGVAGLLLQMLVRNRFVEPSTAGSAESASLGLMVAAVLAPQLPVVGKMLVAAAFAMGGTALFLLILRRIPLRSVLIVPLVGLVLGSVFDSVTTFYAYRLDLLQSVNAWKTGDFSTILRGRYELLWLTLGLTCCAYVAADRFTVAGMGESFTTNLGMNYTRIMGLGLLIVSLVTAMVVVTVGMVPFLGLLVPNLVSLFTGDNARKAIPWVAVGGAGFVLLCDILGRVVRFPYEIPGATIAGVLGSVLFLYVLLRRDARVG
ncbi:iron complex transport system permease protein [Myxococcus fulvus]|uniref:Iron ABC transporter permease n=1 Tax=Myxococcus fulvus TaxID=33 RepID=A0A511SWT3_MYXFU|nr:iron chelate uptake ABC transporter family permease subunit [Myxococcus fulvus]GEN06361.1 iron ABC transporter permease [Myxococcus fulvus]SET50974.1 iron complex transport system permease protein [Myxococcus fulvus]